MQFLFMKGKQMLDTTGPIFIIDPDKSGSSTITSLLPKLPGKNLKEIPMEA